MSSRKLDSRSVSKATDKALCEFLLSPHYDITIRKYKKIKNLSFPEPAKTVTNRIRYLREVKKLAAQEFLNFCRDTHGLLIPSDNQADSESETSSSSNGDSDSESSDEELFTPTFRNYPIKPKTLTFEDVPNTFPKPINMATSANELGKKIVLALPNGLYFCIVWTNVKLNPSTLQIEVSKDQFSVIQKQARPIPKTPHDLLDEYSWGSDCLNYVYQHVHGEIKRLTKGIDDKNKWEESTLLTINKKVVSTFVDFEGKETNTIQSSEDDDGRQHISFFLKMVESMENTPKAATFASPSGVSRNTVDAMDDDDSQGGGGRNIQNQLNNLTAEFHERWRTVDRLEDMMSK